MVSVCFLRSSSVLAAPSYLPSEPIARVVHDPVSDALDGSNGCSTRGSIFYSVPHPQVKPAPSGRITFIADWV